VRVNYTYSVSQPQVADGHIFQKRGLTRSGLPDNVHMLSAVNRLYAEFQPARMRRSFPDRNNIQFFKK